MTIPSCDSAKFSHGERQLDPSVVDIVGMDGPRNTFDDLSHAVIGACIEVHRQLGPGLLESIYEVCLVHELKLRNLPFERQLLIPVLYRGVRLETAYRLDLVVGGALVVELKAVERLTPVHEAQVLTYLRLTGLPTALLVNFNVSVLRNGLRRLTRKELPASPSSRLPV